MDNICTCFIFVKGSILYIELLKKVFFDRANIFENLLCVEVDSGLSFSIY